jgi:hypothetical protein
MEESGMVAHFEVLTSPAWNLVGIGTVDRMS